MAAQWRIYDVVLSTIAFIYKYRNLISIYICDFIDNEEA